MKISPMLASAINSKEDLERNICSFQLRRRLCVNERDRCLCRDVFHRPSAEVSCFSLSGGEGRGERAAALGNCFREWDKFGLDAPTEVRAPCRRSSARRKSTCFLNEFTLATCTITLSPRRITRRVRRPTK